MTNDTSMKPALTAEEWASKRFPLHIRVEEAVDEACARDGYALMALCNAALPDDDPRKFTWADVDNLRIIIGALKETGHDVDDGNVVPAWESLADRIAALLQPR
jgi:hypothetical protein